MVEQGVWRRKSPSSGVLEQSRSGGLGAKPPEAICTMKYCAYKNWFLCIICLYFIAKICTDIKRQAAMAILGMMYPDRGVWIWVR